jgi:hypothetical protein
MMLSPLSRLTLRGLSVGALLSGVAYAAARPLVEALLPLMELLVNSLQSDFLGHLRIIDAGSDPMIAMSCTTRKAIVLAPGQILPPHASFDGGSTHVMHALVPLVLFATVLCAWPVDRLREVVSRVTCGAIALLPLIALTTPLLLVGKVHALFAETAAAAGVTHDAHFVVPLFLFMESGGRWLLPLILGTLCVLLAGGRGRPAFPPITPLNDPGGLREKGAGELH